MASGTFKELIYSLIENLVVPGTYLILALAVVFFMWNMAMAVKNSGNPEELAKFKNNAIWGVVAIFVMISLWGLVAILTNTFFGSSNLIVPVLKRDGSELPGSAPNRSGARSLNCGVGEVADPTYSRCVPLPGSPGNSAPFYTSPSGYAPAR